MKAGETLVGKVRALEVLDETETHAHPIKITIDHVATVGGEIFRTRGRGLDGSRPSDVTWAPFLRCGGDEWESFVGSIGWRMRWSGSPLRSKSTSR